MRGTIGNMRGLIITGVRIERRGATVDSPRQGHLGIVDRALRLVLVAAVERLSGNDGLRGGRGGAGGGIRGGGIGG